MGVTQWSSLKQLSQRFGWQLQYQGPDLKQRKGAWSSPVSPQNLDKRHQKCCFLLEFFSLPRSDFNCLSLKGQLTLQFRFLLSS